MIDCYPAGMRAIFGLLFALLFVVQTASAASPRPPDCCEEMCADTHCVAVSCVCQPVSLPGMLALSFVPAGEEVGPTPSFVNPEKRVEDIWRPPWGRV